MIVIIGESASGKSTVERKLVDNYGFKKTISYTTRPKRENETDGVDYNFISEEEFCELKNKDFFVETATYNGWHYGTPKNECTDDKVAVLTPHGLRQMRKIKGIDVYSVYISVPRRDRLIKILKRGDNIEEAYRRNLSDIGQFDGVKDEVDLIIINNGYQVSSNTICKRIVEQFKKRNEK